MAITAMELGEQRGWKFLSLKSDSMLVFHLFANSELKTPWWVENRCLICLNVVKSIQYRFSQTFIKGNAVDDHMANLAMGHSINSIDTYLMVTSSCFSTSFSLQNAKGFTCTYLHECSEKLFF